MRASKWQGQERCGEVAGGKKIKTLEADVAKRAKITDMFAAGAAVASTSTVAHIVQVELEGGGLAGHGHCQAEEQACE